MAKLYNLARMTTATTGTGTITLGAAQSGYLSFATAGVADGETIAYGIQDGVNSEQGYGVYTASGTTLTRNVINSTNSNTAISLSGTAQVFISPSNRDIGKLTNRRVAKTAAYTLTQADDGATIALGGSAYYALTIPAASGFGSDFSTMILNEDTGTSARGKMLLPYFTSSPTSLTIGTGSKAFTVAASLQFGQFRRWRAYSLANNANWMAGQITYSGTTLTVTVDATGGTGTFTDWQIAPEYLLFPGQITTLVNQNGVWFYTRSRWKVPNNMTLYLDAINGVESNDGLASGAGGAVKSFDVGLRTIAKDFFDFSGISSYPTALLTVQLADNATAGNAGTNAYSAAHIAFTPVGTEGRGVIVINGNAVDASKTVISDTTGAAIGAFSCNVELANVQLGQNGSTAPIASAGLQAADGANINVRASVIFGTSTNQQISALNNGTITFLNDSTVVGGAANLCYTANGGRIDQSTGKFTFSNTPAYSQQVCTALEQSSIIIPNVASWVNGGTVTGTKYFERNLSLIFTNGGTIPGSVAGSTDGTGKVG